MVIHRRENRVEHHHVRDLPNLGLIGPGDLMVVNQTRVLPAYFTATRSATGGHLSGLYLQTTAAGHWQIMLEARGTLREGEMITFANGRTLTLVKALGRGQWEGQTDADLHAVGQTPLPPYRRCPCPHAG